MNHVLNGTGKLEKVLLSPPTFLTRPAPINEISKKYAHEVLDHQKMLLEFVALNNTYEKMGVVCEIQPACEATPNAVFARDFGGCIKEGYILGRFKKSIRETERENYQKKMQELGIPKIAEVKAGYFEGGDFAFIDERTLCIGIADRTDETGVAEIKAQLAPLGYEVHGVKVKPAYLHLDMLFNLVAPDLAIGYTEGLPVTFRELLAARGIRIIGGSEEMIFQHGYNVQALGNGRVLSLKQNQWLNGELSAAGLEVIEVEITEILKAGGGVHCMTFPLKRSLK